MLIARTKGDFFNDDSVCSRRDFEFTPAPSSLYLCKGKSEYIVRIELKKKDEETHSDGSIRVSLVAGSLSHECTSISQRPPINRKSIALKFVFEIGEPEVRCGLWVYLDCVRVKTVTSGGLRHRECCPVAPCNVLA